MAGDLYPTISKSILLPDMGQVKEKRHESEEQDKRKFK